MRQLPYRLYLGVAGRLWQAYPFDRWSEECPACGNGYRDHSWAAAGGARYPAEALVAAVRRKDWRTAFDLGSSQIRMGDQSIIAVLLLRCPSTGRIVVYTHGTGVPTSRGRLMETNILDNDDSSQVAQIVGTWAPVWRNVLEGAPRRADR